MTEGEIRRSNIRSALDDAKKPTNGDSLRDDALRDLLEFIKMGWNRDFQLVTGVKMTNAQLLRYVAALRATT